MYSMNLILLLRILMYKSVEEVDAILSENSITYPSYKIVHLMFTVYILRQSCNSMHCDVISRTYKGEILHRLKLDLTFDFLYVLQICITLLNMISPSTGL